MKSMIVTLFTFIATALSSHATSIYYAHAMYDSVVIFEPGSTMHSIAITIDNNIPGNKWQIGAPQKIFFNSGFQSANAIVTDITDVCVPGDSSVFYIKFYKNSIYPHSSSFAGLGFVHNLDIDTGTVVRVEQLMYNSSNNDSLWINAIDTPYTQGQWTEGKWIWSSQNDTPNLRRSTDGWDTVSVYLWPKYGIHAGYNQVLPNDSVVFRFTYVSNDTSNNREGWIIDNIWPNYIFAGAVDNVDKNAISIYPNPSNGDVFIKSTTQDNEYTEVQIYDQHGRLVYRNAKSYPDYHLHLLLPDGIYILKHITSSGVKRENLVITH